MVTRRILVLLLLCAACLGVHAQTPVFVNEIHYDNTGTDVGEGIEIAGPAGTNLACFRLYLYNGAVPGAAVLYDSIMLSGIINDQCSGYGTVFFPYNNLQNGSNDGIALVFDPTFAGCGLTGPPIVVQLLSYEGVLTVTSAQPAGGLAAGMTSTDIGVFESSGTAIGQSMQLTGTGTLYSDFTWTAGSSATPGTTNAVQGFGGLPCASVTIATELQVTSAPTGCTLVGQIFNMSVCGTDNFGVISSTFTGSVTLSVLSGPGSLSGITTQAVTGGCAFFTLLSLNAVGSYTIRATDGIWSDTVSVYVSANCTTCPTMTAALIDACGIQEGRNEILFFNSGSFAVPVTPSGIVISYGATNPPPTGYTNSLTSNQPYIDSLNAHAGCGTLFYDGLTHSPIPPNTNFLVMNFQPLTVYDFSAWCSYGAIYVVFSNDADWDQGTGNFKNCTTCGGDGSLPRFFRSNFGALTGGGGCDFTYTYTPCTDLACLGNGDGLDFGYGGGAPVASWNACNPFAVLPVLLASELQARRVGTSVRLDWQTATETNSDHFVLARSINRSGPFEPIGQLPAAGFSDMPIGYNWYDAQAPSGTVFYQLQEYDANGGVALTDVAEVGPQLSSANVQVAQQGRQVMLDVAGEGPVRLELYDLSGKVLLRQSGVPGRYALDLQAYASGVYFYRVFVGVEVVVGKLPLGN
jgi:hypothetical protein